MMIRPQFLKKVDQRTLGIEWEDGHQSLYDTTFLRASCTCARCQDEQGLSGGVAKTTPLTLASAGLPRASEWNGEKLLKPHMLPNTVLPVAIDSVGQYGLKIKWNDGHKEGIYTYEHLRSLCQCLACDKS